MAYRFKLKESLRDGVRRIALDQIDRVLEAPHKGDQRPPWVHETRKSIKRTRALLRCVRSGLTESVFRAENRTLADIGRGLSALRDSHVLSSTLETLMGQHETLDVAVTWFASSLDDAGASGGDSVSPVPSARSADASVRRSIKALAKARARLSKLEIAGDLPDVVGVGLRTAQRVGRDALAHLASDTSDENLHDLRKAVQTYQRQHMLISLVWPELETVRIDCARAVAQLLGEAQDLAVLAGFAEQKADVAGREGDEHCACVIAACRERQADLRAVAMPMAARFLAIRPNAAEREFQEGWEAASALAVVGTAARRRGKVVSA